MSEPQQTDAVLGALHAIGVHVAIDDFGVQHSSLSRLRELPVDMLKIDRSFLRGVPEDPNVAAIITAILTLAGALGMQAVAEGVETAEQQRFLVSEGCPLAQGFHLARPMPAEQATAFLLADAGRGAALQHRWSFRTAVRRAPGATVRRGRRLRATGRGRPCRRARRRERATRPPRCRRRRSRCRP